MDLDIDFDLFQKEIIRAAIDHLSGKDEEYIFGWIDGINFTCSIFQEIIIHKKNVEAFNSLSYRRAYEKVN